MTAALRSKSWTSRSLVEEADRALRVTVISGGGGGGTVDQGTAGVDPWLVTGSVSVSNWPATQPVSIAATVAVSGPLTDAQLRAAAVPVSGTFWQATQPVSSTQLPAALVGGRLDVAVGAALPAGTNNIGDVDVLTLPALPAGTNNIGDVDVLTYPGPGVALFPAALVGGRFDVNAGAWLGSTAPTVGSKTSANSIPVVVASDQGAIPVTGTFYQATQPVSIAATVTTKETRSATGTSSNVAGSASSVTILASNANRLGASLYNDSTAILYVKMGATASTTSFAVKLFPDDFYEVPFGYTGVIDGIWASATGSARVTEYT